MFSPELLLFVFASVMRKRCKHKQITISININTSWIYIRHVTDPSSFSQSRMPDNKRSKENHCMINALVCDCDTKVEMVSKFPIGNNYLCFRNATYQHWALLFLNFIRFTFLVCLCIYIYIVKTNIYCKKRELSIKAKLHN